MALGPFPGSLHRMCPEPIAGKKQGFKSHLLGASLAGRPRSRSPQKEGWVIAMAFVAAAELS
jgi:hypothetical protein